MKPVNLYDAKARLSELVQRASGGEEIVIARSGKPAAMLVPLRTQQRPPPGGWEGRIWTAPDFGAADDEIADLMYGTQR